MGILADADEPAFRPLRRQQAAQEAAAGPVHGVADQPQRGGGDAFPVEIVPHMQGVGGEEIGRRDHFFAHCRILADGRAEEA